MRGSREIEMKNPVFFDRKWRFSAPPITYLLGRLLARRIEATFLRADDAKRPANIEVFLRLGVADPLWRPVPDSALLQQTVLAPTPGTYSPAQAQLERLPSGRSDFGLSLHPDRRTSAGEQDGDSAVQWIVSLLGRAQEVPDQTALRRYLRRLSPKAVRQLARLHDQMRAQLFDLPHPRSSLTFHLD